eukprot:jgi/Chlat1/4193/Chrsp27S04287
MAAAAGLAAPCAVPLSRLLVLPTRRPRSKQHVTRLRAANTTTVCLQQKDETSHGPSKLRQVAAAAALSLALTLSAPNAAQAKRLEGVNRPELLPKEFTTLIDVAGFLTNSQVCFKFIATAFSQWLVGGTEYDYASQEARIKRIVADLERDTGYKLRVLAQNYPETPGLAIKDYWGVDDRTIVFVADPNTGNILNFNVGGGVDLEVPRSFWSRLQGKYGTKFFWQENGEDASILAAVDAIDNCLREPDGRGRCSTVL